MGSDHAPVAGVAVKAPFGAVDELVDERAADAAAPPLGMHAAEEVAAGERLSGEQHGVADADEFAVSGFPDEHILQGGCLGGELLVEFLDGVNDGLAEIEPDGVKDRRDRGKVGGARRSRLTGSAHPSTWASTRSRIVPESVEMSGLIGMRLAETTTVTSRSGR